MGRNLFKTMKIIIDNDFILKSLKVKDKLTEEMLEVEKVNERLIKENDKNQADFQNLITKLKREDEKVRPELQREADKIEKGEYDIVTRVYLGKEGDEKGKAIIEISNGIEEIRTKCEKEIESFKAKIKKENESKQDNNSDTTPTDGDGGDNTETLTEEPQNDNS